MISPSKKGREFEATICEDLNRSGIPARLVPGSGCGKFDKGDIETLDYLIDAKTTDKAQYILKKSTLDNLTKWARGKLIAIVLQLGGKRYALVDYDYWKELTRNQKYD